MADLYRRTNSARRRPIATAMDHTCCADSLAVRRSPLKSESRERIPCRKELTSPRTWFSSTTSSSGRDKTELQLKTTGWVQWALRLGAAGCYQIRVEFSP